MLLCELMQFTMDDTQPSNASERFRLKGEEATDKKQLRTVLAQLVQATLSGMIRKKEADNIKQYLEMRMRELSPEERVENNMKRAGKFIVPAQIQPFGPNVRY